jgi:hypothetical protein
MSRPRFIVASFVVVSFLAAGTFVAADKPPAKKAADKPSAEKTEDPFAEGRSPTERRHPPSLKKVQTKKAGLPANVQRKRRSGETAIEEALNEPTQMEFLETPLSDVIDYLKECHAIEIQLDKKALDDVGISTDTPVTINLRGVPLRSALNLMLRGLGLTRMIQDDVLLITTPEEQDCRLVRKVYDVSDLVVCRDEHGFLWDDYDTLIDVITTTLMPPSGCTLGDPPGGIVGASLGRAKVLVVLQTYDVHSQIVSLLAEVRQLAKKYPDAPIPLRSRPIPKAREKNLPPTTGGTVDGLPVQLPAPPKSPIDTPPATPKASPSVPPAKKGNASR